MLIDFIPKNPESKGNLEKCMLSSPCKKLFILPLNSIF